MVPIVTVFTPAAAGVPPPPARRRRRQRPGPGRCAACGFWAYRFSHAVNALPGIGFSFAGGLDDDPAAGFRAGLPALALAGHSGTTSVLAPGSRAASSAAA